VFVADLVDIKCMKQNSELDVIHWGNFTQIGFLHEKAMEM
jgi:hypothetical protein